VSRKPLSIALEEIEDGKIVKADLPIGAEAEGEAAAADAAGDAAEGDAAPADDAG
jgi:hypothetical protein